MSDPQGLYYEISLTNRQVLAGVLILLLCVTGAFVGGVLVGRGSGTGHAAQVGTEGEGGTLDESFRFFEPAGEDSSSADSEAQETPPATSEAPAGTPVEPRPEPSPPVEATSRPARAAEPEAEDSPAQESEARAAAAGDVVIQVFSSHDEAQARNMLERLRGRDFEAFLSPTEVDGRAMYRVRVGPFAERTRAETVAERLKRELRVDTWITRADS